jgi:hypothetical protein
MAKFVSEKSIRKFEKKYNELREDLLTRNSSDSDSVYNRKLELLNTMENANRVFLYFAETGKVDLKALD